MLSARRSKLTGERQLSNVLDHELTPEEDEESPEVLKLIHQNYLIYYQVNEGNKTVEVRAALNTEPE
jgi:hypothetical protein